MWAKIIRLCFLCILITVGLWVGLRNEIMNWLFFRYFAFVVAKKKENNGTVFIDVTFDCVLKILCILQQQISICILNVACSMIQYIGCYLIDSFVMMPVLTFSWQVKKNNIDERAWRICQIFRTRKQKRSGVSLIISQWIEFNK